MGIPTIYPQLPYDPAEFPAFVLAEMESDDTPPHERVLQPEEVLPTLANVSACYRRIAFQFDRMAETITRFGQAEVLDALRRIMPASRAYRLFAQARGQYAADDTPARQSAYEATWRRYAEAAKTISPNDILIANAMGLSINDEKQ